MAVLISPSNNTGWGLGTSRMFGGARTKSAQHPVFVHAHYRARWGSHGRRARVGRRTGRRAGPMDAATAAAVEATIDEVARNGPPGARAAITVARRVANGRYNLRRTRRLTPAGRAVLAARARRLARAARRGRVAILRTVSGRRVHVRRRRRR